MAERHDAGERTDIFPRPLLLGAGALVAVALVLATAGGLTRRSRAAAAGGAVPVEARSLRFVDAEDGGVLVYDARSGVAFDTIGRGEENFVRGSLRGLARERRLRGVAAEVPFHLARYADGRLTLDDSATGAHVELNAFGETNAAAFAAFLSRPEPPIR